MPGRYGTAEERGGSALSPAALHELALRIREAYDTVSPYIEKHTAGVCPACLKVCCIDRHGAHEPQDELFIETLGAGVPPERPKAIDTEPCRHLSRQGCTIKRHLRPFRCTWYFCDALLEAMPLDGARAYRRFVADLARLVALRGEFLDALMRV